MIRRILNNKLLVNSNPSRSVLSAVFVITSAGLASRFLGLLRDRFLASTFGAGDVLDIYYASFRIPDLLYNLLILGALSAAFIPVFTGLISQDKEKEAWILSNSLLNLAVIFIVGLSLVMAVFASPIMNLIAPGFSEEKMDQVVLFTRIMFLSPLFLGISGIFGGILTSFKRFLSYSLAPIFYNLGIIIGVVFLVDLWGPVGLAWGVVLGAFLHMVVQYPAARNLGFKHTIRGLDYLSNKDVRKVVKLMIPRTLGIAVTQINLLVITIFASTLASGSLAIFNFAQNLQSVPIGLIGISFSIAVFPVLSTCFAREDKKGFIDHFSQTFRQILFFVIPMSVFMLLLRAQLVRVILGAGKFDWEDTTLTFEVLGVFALSLFAQSLIPLLARSFYAMHDTKTPFYAALATEAINIITVLFLINQYQLLGLAVAFTISGIFQMLVLLFILRIKFENLDDKKIFESVKKIAIASFFAGMTIQLFKYLMGGFSFAWLNQNFYWRGLVDMDTFIGVFLHLSISAAMGAISFISVVYFLKSEEFICFKNSFTRRIFKAKKEIVEDTSDVSGIL